MAESQCPNNDVVPCVLLRKPNNVFGFNMRNSTVIKVVMPLSTYLNPHQLFIYFQGVASVQNCREKGLHMFLGAQLMFSVISGFTQKFPMQTARHTTIKRISLHPCSFRNTKMSYEIYQTQEKFCNYRSNTKKSV